jgi:uncharacterized SAM-dependent methyltransferase
VTARFNLNLLARINRELGSNFVIGNFSHAAIWNEAASAIEMHLVSRCAQSVRVGAGEFRFSARESIHTESSRKYDIPQFTEVARRSGWEVARMWTDSSSQFAVFGLI